MCQEINSALKDDLVPIIELIPTVYSIYHSYPFLLTNQYVFNVHVGLMTVEEENITNNDTTVNDTNNNDDIVVS